MRTRSPIVLGVLAGLLVMAGFAFAASAKTYQVTGPVLSVSDTTIVVQKGNDKWELDRDPNTKVTGDLKVGAKVTVQYRMIAMSVEVKAGDAPAKPAPKKGK